MTLVPVIASLALVAIPATNLSTRILAPYVRPPLPKAPVGPQTTFVYDRQGKLMTTLHAGINRTPIRLQEMPDSIKQAVIAVEDKDFYHHKGVDFEAVVRAALADLRNRRLVQGGSTITQQYVKNTYTGPEKSLDRKLKEAALALKMEQKYNKDQILEKYLNSVYFGAGAYGIQAAARTYFDKPASKLSVLQSATLAGLIASPARFDPRKNRDLATERRNLVLRDMAEQGYITPERAARLQRRPIKLHLPKETLGGVTSYFAQYVTDRLVRSYGYDATFKGGLRVRTTLDSRMQRAAEAAVANWLPKPEDPSAALVAIDPRTGAIRAMVGGRNFGKKKFNLAAQAHRTTGSAFKMFTLAAAMEQRVALDSTWNGPSELIIDDPRCFDPKKQEPWDVHNYADEGHGTMSLSQAIAQSVNTIFAQLVVEVGPDKVADVAHRLGIRSRLSPVCSITLGSQVVTPLEMTSAYASLAARGIYHRPTSIFEVKSPSGRVIHTAEYTGKRTFDQNDADLVTYALQGVIRSGTGTAAAIGRPAAGKTGTAQDYVDAWFCGYVPQLAACVWVGYPKKEIPMHNIEGFANVFGGSIPARIWHDFMATAISGLQVLDFPKPSFAGYDVYPSGTGEPAEGSMDKSSGATRGGGTPSSSGGTDGGGAPAPEPSPTRCWPPGHCSKP